MSNVHYQGFDGVRCRFKRLTYEKLFNVWLFSLSEKWAQLTTESSDGVSIGDEFKIHGYADMQSISFDGRLKMVKAPNTTESMEPKQDDNLQSILVPKHNILVMQICSEIRLATSTESGRFNVENMQVKVPYDGKVLEGLGLDVSTTGIGLILPQTIDPDTVISLGITKGEETLNTMGRVCYCREYAHREGWYRLGVKFEGLTRIEMHRLQQSIRAISAA